MIPSDVMVCAGHNINASAGYLTLSEWHGAVTFCHVYSPMAMAMTCAGHPDECVPDTRFRASVQGEQAGDNPRLIPVCALANLHVSDFERFQLALRVADGLTAEHITGHKRMRDDRSACRLPYTRGQAFIVE